MITLKSHGFKFGRPEANYYFDVSFFKNPWRDEAIRKEENREVRKELVVSFMKNQEGVYEIVREISLIIANMNKAFPGENLIVALCCSAGEYRSPAMVEMISEKINGFGVVHSIEHSKYSKI